MPRKTQKQEVTGVDKADQKDKDIGKLVLREKQYYEQATQKIRDKFQDLYDLYMGVLPPSKHKSLSRNFVPKTHQAVETMASFLAGGTTEFFCQPVGTDDGQKAVFANKWLSAVARKIGLKPTTLTMAKGGLLFGVSVVKVVWDSDEKYPCVSNINIGDLYCSPFERDLRNSDTSVIQRLLLPIDYVEKKYKVSGLVPVSAQTNVYDSTMFDTTELDTVSRTLENRAELLERWTKDKIVTIVVQPGKAEDGTPTPSGIVLREIENKRKKLPFHVFRCSDSPLPNRFYTPGLIEPNMRTQKRLNALINQFVDQTNIISSPPAVIRRGSGINPRELVTFAGRAITATDPARDISWLQIPDTTGSMVRLYQLLDSEFQRGTSVTSARQGMGNAGSASEARINQANLDTVTNIVKENLEYTLSGIGQDLLDLMLENKSSDTFRIFDAKEVFDFEVKTGMRPMDPTNPDQPLPMSQDEIMDIKTVGRVFNYKKGDIDSSLDVTVRADSTILQNRDILRKQLQDWASFLNGMGVRLNVEEMTQDWGLLSGIPNAQKYISKDPPPQPPPPTQPDQAKIIAAIADLVKSGAEVYPNQVQAALMGQWPLPQGQGTPIISPAAAKQANDLTQQIAPQVGPGGGQGMETPGQAQTSSGVTDMGQAQTVQPGAVSPLTQ